LIFSGYVLTISYTYDIMIALWWERVVKYNW